MPPNFTPHPSHSSPRYRTPNYSSPRSAPATFHIRPPKHGEVGTTGFAVDKDMYGRRSFISKTIEYDTPIVTPYRPTVPLPTFSDGVPLSQREYEDARSRLAASQYDTYPVYSPPLPHFPSVPQHTPQFRQLAPVSPVPVPQFTRSPNPPILAFPPQPRPVYVSPPVLPRLEEEQSSPFLPPPQLRYSPHRDRSRHFSPDRSRSNHNSPFASPGSFQDVGIGVDRDALGTSTRQNREFLRRQTPGPEGRVVPLPPDSPRGGGW